MWPIAQCNANSTNLKSEHVLIFLLNKGACIARKNLDEKIHKSQISANHKYFIEGFK